MIYGIGIDQIEVKRISRSILNDKFLTKIFSEKEIQYCEKFKNKDEHFAARFAAKEAFLKAFGTGLRNGFSMNEIEITNNKPGKPELRFYGKSLELVNSSEIMKFHVSLTHLKETVCAMVVLEK
ncbi:MAG: holo-ACP synthase [Candidatus Cloacimonetes bacterium]|nr:holo-ACP synthase [Candidatus Cloacimonadota bacterium]